jgi:hypothetical protein
VAAVIAATAIEVIKRDLAFIIFPSLRLLPASTLSFAGFCGNPVDGEAAAISFE